VIAFDGDVAFSEHAVSVKAARTANAHVLRRKPIVLLDIWVAPAEVVALNQEW